MVVIKPLFDINKYVLRQFLLSSVGLVDGACVGGIFGFTSILFLQLKYDNSINLDPDQESWIASIPTLVMFPACVLNSWTLETCGRKTIIIFAEIVSLAGWLTIFFANSYEMFLGARILLGIFAGIAYPTFITFLGEVSMPQYRSVLLTLLPFGTTIGTLVVQLLGEHIHWKLVAAVFAFFPLYNLSVTCYIKDSYVTHLDRNRLDEARATFKWFRGEETVAIREFEDILEEKHRKRKESFGQLLRICMSKSFLIPLGITSLVFLTNELTATQAITFYTSSIVAMIEDNPQFQYYAILTLNILRIAAVILSSFLVKLSSVRFILISSGVALGFSLLTMGLFMYLSVIFEDVAALPVITLVLLVLNTVLYGIGLGPLPSVVCGEMFPQSTRSIGGCLSASFSFLFLFGVVKFMPILLTVIGPYWTFIIFGGSTLVGITASHFVLPNTKNKTLQEISKLYQTGNESKENGVRLGVENKGYANHEERTT